MLEELELHLKLSGMTWKAHLTLVPQPILSNELELLVETSLLKRPPWGGVHLRVLGWAAPIVAHRYHPCCFSRVSENVDGLVKAGV